MTGWLFIIACSACSVLIGHLFKITGEEGLEPIHVLTVNYMVAAAFSFGISLLNGTFFLSISHYSVGIGLLALTTGWLFIANFFIYSQSVRHNGLGISVAAMRVSLLIPVLLSAFWYGEQLATLQWAGIILVFLILFLLLPGGDGGREGAGWWHIFPLLLFVLTGFGDSALKIFEEESSASLHSSFFMGTVFLSSFLAGRIWSLKGDRPAIQKDEYLMGLKIGLPNLLTPLFLIGALQQMNGAVVYSSVSIITVIGGTLLGILLWSDRLTISQGIGLSLSLLAILFLVG
ncbi:MAG TPA: EamA family transporter [Balneolaceae bacterium]|nr:EamA family transporter [Balneolaceae bacterium]